MILTKGFGANLPFCRTCLFHLSFPCSFTVFSEFCALFLLFSLLFPVLQVCFCLFFSSLLLFFCFSFVCTLVLFLFKFFPPFLSLFSPFPSSFLHFLLFFPIPRSDKSGKFWHGIIFHFVYKVLVFSLLYFTYTHFAQIFPKTCHFFVALCFYILI